jgi:hypothetical protein
MERHLVEQHDAGGLALAAGEFRRARAGPSGRAGNDGDAVRVKRPGAADGEIFILAYHVAARHDEELVDVGRARDDRLVPEMTMPSARRSTMRR